MTEPSPPQQQTLNLRLAEKVLESGGRTDRYTWSQTAHDVSVCIPVPAGTTAKMLNVKIQTSNIEVHIKGGKTLVSGALHSTVHPDECFWTLDKDCLDVTLNKASRMDRWKCVVVGDAEIDVTSEDGDDAILSENVYLSDLDVESRHAFEKLMLDRISMAQGLPPTHHSLLSPAEQLAAHAAADQEEMIGVRCTVFPHATAHPPAITPSAHGASNDAPPAPAVPSRGDEFINALDAEVKQLALSLHGLKLGLKEQCADYAKGLAVQGVLSVDDLRRVSESEAWSIIKRAGVKIVPQHTLMSALFGPGTLDPDRAVEDRFALVPPPQEINKQHVHLTVKMEAQKQAILNDQAAPLTDADRATLSVPVQQLYGLAKFVLSRQSLDHLPRHLQRHLGELHYTYLERLHQWETKVRTLPPDEADKFVKRLVVERAVHDKREEVNRNRMNENDAFLHRVEERRAKPDEYQPCELHPITIKTVNFMHHAMSYYCIDCWRGICPLCYGSCCRNHHVRTIETILRGVEDSITRGQEQRKELIKEEEKKKAALSTMRERLLADGDKEGVRQQQLGIKRCNERIASSDEYVETLRAQLKFLESTFHLPGVGNSKGMAAQMLQEWFKSHGVGADWQGQDLAVRPNIVDPAPDDETEAVTKQALELSLIDDDEPPMLIAIGEGAQNPQSVPVSSALPNTAVDGRASGGQMPRPQDTGSQQVATVAATQPVPAMLPSMLPCHCNTCGRAVTKK